MAPASLQPPCGLQVAPEVPEGMLKEMGEMGFGAHRATRALHFTQGAGVEHAVNWLMEHEGDADLDEPLMVAKVWQGGQGGKGGGGAGAAAPEEEPTHGPFAVCPPLPPSLHCSLAYCAWCPPPNLQPPQPPSPPLPPTPPARRRSPS
jgi:hypothetical protein